MINIVYILIITFLTIILIFFLLRKGKDHFQFNNNEIPSFAEIQNNNEISLNFNFDKSENTIGKYIVFDLETTGLPKKVKSTPDDFANWPRIIQISWILFDSEGKQINWESHYINQEKPIPSKSIKIHHITDEIISQKGEPASKVWERFLTDLSNCEFVVAHNTGFDIPIIESELYRINQLEPFKFKKLLCTMAISKNFCKIPCMNGGRYKNPNLEEMLRFCFFPNMHEIHVSGLHNATIDTAITSKCFLYFVENKHVNV